jgi:nickel-type superoxide dismutase maturation protease
MRRLAGRFGAALLFAFGAVAIIDRLGRSWDARVAVEGHSMEPALRDGDLLFVDPNAYRSRAPRLGELVVTRHPSEEALVIVKRVIAVNRVGDILVAGDHPAHKGEALQIGRLASTSVIGRPWFRYWPLERAGRIS